MLITCNTILNHSNRLIHIKALQLHHEESRARKMELTLQVVIQRHQHIKNVMIYYIKISNKVNVMKVVTNQIVWIGRLWKFSCSSFWCWFYISSICVHAKCNCSHAVPIVVSSSSQTTDGVINLFRINFFWIHCCCLRDGKIIKLNWCFERDSNQCKNMHFYPMILQCMIEVFHQSFANLVPHEIKMN